MTQAGRLINEGGLLSEEILVTLFSPRGSPVHVPVLKNKMRSHLYPLSIVLYHEYDAGVRLIQSVSVQQSFARHAQLDFGDTGCWTAEAGCRGGGLQNIIHPGSGQERSANQRSSARRGCGVALRDGKIQ